MAKKVLLGLHDDPIMRMYASVYERKDCTVHKVTNLQAMLDSVVRESYDAYLMDINLGSPGGEDISPAVAVYSLVKARVEAREARFLSVSGCGALVMKARAAGLPAKPKPFPIEDLIELVR